MINVLIGIQARTNSTRLPAKAYKDIGGASLIHRVIDQCLRAATWMMKSDYENIIKTKVVVLIPNDDPLRKHIEHRVEVFEGHETDVLSRYIKGSKNFGADYTVRITGDCAWITSKIIAKGLRDAIIKKADYTSNVLVRTYMEGYDTEVLSKKCLKWLDENAKTDYEREHVTIKIVNDIEKGLMPDLKLHTILNDYDLSHIKTSIDTQEEYESSLALHNSLKQKKYLASRYGSISN